MLLILLDLKRGRNPFMVNPVRTFPTRKVYWNTGGTIDDLQKMV